ncbi:hypothetical protein [Marinobacter sp.]|uniref:hypothetical protein n=1 Tax=Marinobacter sp. TaxID=50741 RepID=UPI003A93E09F
MHSISPYLIKTYDRNLAGPHDEKYCSLDKIRGNNLIDVVDQFTAIFIDTFSKVEEGEKKSFKFSDINRTDTEIYGYMQFGVYGNASEIHNISSGEKVYDKKVDESDINKFFFYFKILPGSRAGFFFSQNIHGNGIKSEFSKKFNEFYKNKTKGLNLQFNPFSSKNLLKDWYENANVKEIKINEFSAGHVKEIADQLHESFAEVTFKPTKRNSFFGKLSEVKGKSDIITILSQYGKKVSAVAELNGKKRTFSLSSEGEPLSAIEIDEVVDIIDGNPTFDSMETEVRKISEEFQGELDF